MPLNDLDILVYSLRLIYFIAQIKHFYIPPDLAYFGYSIQTLNSALFTNITLIIFFDDKCSAAA